MSRQSDRRLVGLRDFYLDLAGGLSGCTAGAVFHHAHLPDELARAYRAEQDGLAI